MAVKLFKVLKSCPDQGIEDQMLRSAVSVPSNVAEGAERDSRKDFIRFLRISKGSAAELRTQLHIASLANLVNATSCAKAKSEVVEISRMLQGLIVSLAQGNKTRRSSHFKPQT